MSSPKFAEMYNMVAFLEKPVESDGFAEIIDFLKASSVHYALTVNPIIYISCIEQFWATTKVQTVNRVRQLQALVDKKRVIITKSSIRSDLHLDDARIFEELARMGYEKPSQKLTFYKAFFSPQWKYFIHTITQCLSAKSTAWNKFSSTMDSLIICLATNQKFNLSKYIFDAMVKHLDGGVKFLMYPRFLQVFINQQLGDMSHHKKIFVNPFHTKNFFANIKRAGKDFSRRITPLFDTMMVQASEEVDEDSDHLTDSDQIPIIDQPSTSSQPKQKQKTKRRQRKEAEVPQDETEHKESVPTPFNDLQPSGEDSMQLNDLMVLCTKLQAHVLDLEKAKRVESSEDQESLGDHEDASKQGRSNANIDADIEMPVEIKVDEKDEQSTKLDDSTASEAVTTASVEDSAAPTTIEEITLAQTLIQIKAAKPKVIAGERTQSEKKERVTDERKRKTIYELMEKRRKTFLLHSEHKKENRPLIRHIRGTQMLHILKHWWYTYKQLKGRASKRKTKVGRKRAGKEQEQESSKKQRMEEDKESDEVDEASEDDEVDKTIWKFQEILFNDKDATRNRQRILGGSLEDSKDKV
ncbi:hypothetical protein Tco_0804446 [Tanacetum coccineum]|uniref:Uncharacterized protein n=1 Tax=Tanacetum coccineum TaxID=301880 RepID=A0ABQ5A8P4_9ASTR